MSAILAELPGQVHEILFCLTLLVLVPLMIWAAFDLEQRKARWQSRRHAARVRRQRSSKFPDRTVL